MKKGKPYKSLYWPALLIVGTVLTLLIVIGVSTYRNIGRERGRTEELLLREGLTVIRVIEADLTPESPAVQPDISRIKKLISEVSRQPGVNSIVLFDAGGYVVAASPAMPAGERIRDAGALIFLSREKGFITRHGENPKGERTFEVIKPFYSSARQDPVALSWGARATTEPQKDVSSGWLDDKVISLSFGLGAFEQARKEDLHHAYLMGSILVVLGAGALYFIFIVQNYYLVDRSLARMKTYTENVVESMADGLVSIDNERKIVTLNRRAGELLGAGEENLRGVEISKALGQNINRLLKGPEAIIRGQEIEVENSLGKRIPLSLSAAPVKDELGREMGSVLLLRDLREIRDLQEKVRRTEHLASLGRLAAGVAHEIRNPLSSIRGFAQLFLGRLKGREEEGYAAIMVKEVDRLNRVITDLLDFARPKEPRREPYSLEETLEHSLTLLAPELAKKGVAIEKEYEPGIPAVFIDHDQLSQAFLNLLLNSLESIEGGGKIRITLKGTRERSEVEVAIADTGRGIPSEDLEKIFEPFFSTKRKGTGLGLAIVHQIIENHGGTIAVESQEGMGTTFRITLPVMDIRRS